MQTSTPSFKTLLAVCSGNALEWYDFMVYNALLIYISFSFFPNHNRTISLLATMASSGVAFVARPIGGVLLSVWADRHGHRRALLMVFKLMALSMLILTLTPSYSSIGVVATILIVFARILQGLAAGGEFGIASAVLIELAPRHKTGLWTSLQMVGQLLAILMAIGFCLLLTSQYSHEAIINNYWRIPFAAGLLILPVGIFLRWQLQSGFIKKNPEKIKLFLLIKQQRKSLFMAMGLVSAVTGSIYTLFSYMPIFSHLYLHLSDTQSYLGTGAGLITTIVMIPISGFFSDKMGKKPILLASLCLYLMFAYPLLSQLIEQPNLTNFIAAEVTLGLFIGAFFGVFTAVVGELFPANIRSSCLAISYNTAVVLFGGFAPLIITAIIERTHQPMTFTYYLMIMISISLIAAFHYEEKDAATEFFIGKSHDNTRLA